MGKARIKTRTKRHAARPRELAALLRVSLTIAASLLMVFLLDLLGAVAAIDEGLERRYVELGEALGAGRETSESIVVVAGDHDTIEAWGPPPWPAKRLAAIIEQIEDSDPDVIAELGYARMFVANEALTKLVDSRGAELLIQSADSQRASPWSGVGLEHGELVLGPNSQLAQLADRSDRLGAMPERLPIHWLTPASRLPVVPAHQVAAGKIPAQTFAGRVVLLGLTDPNAVMPVATPVGPLSPVEVEAHALTGLADAVVWAELPVAWSYLGCAVLGLSLLLLFSRTDGPWLVIVPTVGLGVLLIVDFVLYQRGVVRLGSGHALLMVLAISLSHCLSEAAATFVGLARLRAQVLRINAGLFVAERESMPDDLEYWRDLAELGSEYAQEVVAGAVAVTVLERIGDEWTLAVRASAKLDPDIHASLAAQQQLDIRRAPFRAVWLTLRAASTTELLSRDPSLGRRTTLIVPLEDEGELLGLWLVHLHDDREFETEEIETFEAHGRQMAGALVRRRERRALGEQVGGSRPRDQVETIVSGLRLLHDEHRWALELLEQLPVRSMIATVWGELEFVDPRLRDDLARRYPALFDEEAPAQNLRTVLALLTGKSLDEAHRLMRKVVRGGMAIELDAALTIEEPGDVWVLSRIRSERGIDLPGFRPAVHEHILLMARSSAPAQTIKTRSGALLRVLGGS